MEHIRALDDVEALRAVADPARVHILRRLMAGPQTISSLGAELGRHPAWVRHHIKVLESVGLVELAEIRTTRNYTEKFYRACAPAYVVNMLVRPVDGERDIVIAVGSHDFALELLAAEVGPTGLVAGAMGSLDGLVALRQGHADVAGCHLLDAETGEYNVPYAKHFFVDRGVRVVTLANREQGLIVSEGNPHGLKEPADLIGTPLRFANRNRGSGTRVWLDRYLHERGVEPAALLGYEREVGTHTEAAGLVASGEADAAVGVRAAADRFGLGFVPLFEERYDLVVPEDSLDRQPVVDLLERLHEAKFRKQVDRIAGYSTTETGDEHRVAG